MQFAPEAFRSTRITATERVRIALLDTNDLREVTPERLRKSPGALSTLRMCTAPPLAMDRLVGLAGINKSLIGRMEAGRLAVRMRDELIQENLASVCRVILKLLDRDVFPWLDAASAPTDAERERAATIVADRLCSAVANPIVRNAQEQRQLELIGTFLNGLGYRKLSLVSGTALRDMKAGTYSFRQNVPLGTTHRVNIPVDVVVQPRKLGVDRLPILIEAKSAGDFTNTNKRRKEEATKIRQLKEAYGVSVRFILFLCGYFGTDYLGYEAAEGIDWVWEHRIDDLKQLGL